MSRTEVSSALSVLELPLHESSGEFRGRCQETSSFQRTFSLMPPEVVGPWAEPEPPGAAEDSSAFLSRVDASEPPVAQRHVRP